MVNLVKIKEKNNSYFRKYYIKINQKVEQISFIKIRRSILDIFLQWTVNSCFQIYVYTY